MSKIVDYDILPKFAQQSLKSANNVAVWKCAIISLLTLYGHSGVQQCYINQH